MLDFSDSDKRVSPRAGADFVMEVYEDNGKKLVGIARLLNLSLSGICVSSTSDLSDKLNMSVRLLLGQRNMLAIPVDMVWKKSYPHTTQYGLRFGAYSDAYKEVILKFMKEYFAEFEDVDLDFK